MSTLHYPVLEEFDDSGMYEEAYQNMYRLAYNAVAQHNMVYEKHEYAKQSLNDYRERYDKQKENISSFHNAMVEFHKHMSNMFRTKQIKSLTEYNALVDAWGKVSNGWLKPIKAEDLFSAKANIIIEGTYTNDYRDIEYIKNIISHGFQNFGDNSISINFVGVEDIYDVEELTSTEEG
jgi:hypothetical protein